MQCKSYKCWFNGRNYSFMQFWNRLEDLPTLIEIVFPRTVSKNILILELSVEFLDGIIFLVRKKRDGVLKFETYYIIEIIIY